MRLEKNQHSQISLFLRDLSAGVDQFFHSAPLGTLNSGNSGPSVKLDEIPRFPDFIIFAHNVVARVGPEQRISALLIGGTAPRAHTTDRANVIAESDRSAAFYDRHQETGYQHHVHSLHRDALDSDEYVPLTYSSRTHLP